ncbi:MAG: T9SS type A sorting domain-containing protein, partial [Ignavibacteriales bacterium]|nr:T9SS type A sorting domain-containing protein [Ignavibacteriales bacterium]
TPPPDNSTSLLVYDDALQSPWMNNSWSASTTFGSTEQKQSGTSSIKTTLTSAWGALSLHYGAWGVQGINPASYTGLEFAVYAPASGTSLSIFFESDNGQTFPKVNTGTIAAGNWKVISIPMSQLNPNGLTINRISIQEISGSTKTFYIDNFKFSGSAPAPSVPATPTLASPSNGSTNVGLNPSLMWNASTGAATYRVQVSAASSFSTTLFDQAGVSGTTFGASGFSNGAAYYWRVNATNASGTSGWSGTSSFTTVAAAPPPDTTKPTVSITAPANGGTVSGTVTIGANASDNVKLAGVQFKVNGANQGAEVTASPYQTSWNTTQVANGSYTVTAVARDSAGNLQSAVVTVTVANNAPAPSADLSVYDDALKNPWINSSWTATVSFNSTEQKASGSSSIKVDQGAWGGLRFHSGAWGSAVAIDPSKYSAISFAIHGGSVGISLGVFLANDQNQSFPAVKYVWVAANQWKTMTFPMSQLNPNNQTVHSLVIQDMSGRVRTYYVDDIKFVSATQTLSKAVDGNSETAEGGSTSATFELGQNYPNPFNPMTTIQYSLAAPANVKMEIFNMIGQRVELLVDRQQSSGSHQVSFNGSLLPSGVYFYRLTAQPLGENAQPLVIMKKMTLTK